MQAIDGIHVHMKVSRFDTPRYHGEKDYPTQNMLAACLFNLKFIYILSDWKETVSDLRIIKMHLEENIS